jgi:hypothetical protein
MPDDDIEIDWGAKVLIPEGDYQVMYVSHETTKGSFGPKVNITFRIITFGEYFETLLEAHYNVKDGSLSGKRKSIKLSRHSKLVLELIKVLGCKVRPGRLSPAALKGLLIWVKVKTVKTNSKQQQLPELLWYSKVDSMIGQSDASELTSSALPKLEPKVLPALTLEPIPTIKSAIEG